MAVVLGAIGGVSACIIGPKQDDPADVPIGDPPDTAAPPGEDTGDKLTSDVGTGPFLEAGSESDAAPLPSDTGVPAADTSIPGDASDAGGDADAGASDGGDAADSDGGGSDAVASD